MAVLCSSFVASDAVERNVLPPFCNVEREKIGRTRRGGGISANKPNTHTSSLSPLSSSCACNREIYSKVKVSQYKRDTAKNFPLSLLLYTKHLLARERKRQLNMAAERKKLTIMCYEHTAYCVSGGRREIRVEWQSNGKCLREIKNEASFVRAFLRDKREATLSHSCVAIAILRTFFVAERNRGRDGERKCTLSSRVHALKHYIHSQCRALAAQTFYIFAILQSHS